MLSLPEKRRNALLASITPLEVEHFRNSEKASGKSATTVNFGVKVLRGFFNDTRRKGFITTNPAEAVEFLPEEIEERLPFDDEQVKALLKAAKADGTGEWVGMILFGFHGGLRLTDAADLSWDNIDLAAHTLTFRAKKTAKRSRGNKETTIALHQDVMTYLDLLSVTDIPGQENGRHGQRGKCSKHVTSLDRTGASRNTNAPGTQNRSGGAVALVKRGRAVVERPRSLATLIRPAELSNVAKDFPGRAGSRPGDERRGSARIFGQLRQGRSSRFCSLSSTAHHETA